jgi:TrfA protein
LRLGREELYCLNKTTFACSSRFHYFGSLITEGIKDDRTRHYLIKVNPKLAPLFYNGWTSLDVAQRRELRGKPLALWLQAFYASHDQPYPYKVETLRNLAGSRTKDLFKFHQNLRQALTHLQSVGTIKGWEIEASNDLVYVYKVSAIADSR